ncbi:MAG: cyclic nucleotide-binding domain-containing protein [Lentisphaerae bacterium]|nr:cyclic nucleotide-binding domain-containing protein [Lentisphaerota bacterium]
MNPLRDFFYSNPSHIFHGMAKEHLDLLLACASEVEFAPGTTIFKTGDSASRFYLIYLGEVAVRVPGYQRGDATVESLTTGQVLGISWLMEPYVYKFDAVAEEPTRALAFDAAAVRTQCQSNPRFGFDLLLRFTNTIASRLEAARLQMQEMARESEEREALP